ncbi:hypothetical protein BpHYR1_015367 [Brachionus plicatilis]|uniref:Uncharacterized protein n=1 Tax=Brachionus plicatilis TaxID=10195 RepID=A0A3M7P2P6_BRAPC|nr:hypothetical protein BpHYR1_015367 [Brachionus plicatilis]
MALFYYLYEGAYARTEIQKRNLKKSNYDYAISSIKYHNVYEIITKPVVNIRNSLSRITEK